jgi:hypothetical protein
MIQYKYNLDSSSKKFICPNCNKRTFVKYIDAETNNYLSENFGRCDRETSCSYLNTPTGENKNTYEFVNIPKPEPSFHDYSLVSQSGRNYKQNNFVQFLKTLFNEVEVKEVVLKYLIGTSKHWNGATVFWQIDNFERVHAGKILQYIPETCKRAKDENGKSLIHWAHSLLKYSKAINEFHLKQCLFGLHLINERNTKIIALVEAEKTAVLMSVFKPDYVWLATGSESGFKLEYLLPIKKYKIIAFPDKSELDKWNTKAIELNKLGFQIIVNDWLEKTDHQAGTDFADIFIENWRKMAENGEPTPLIRTIYTQTEKTVNELQQHTSGIWELINTFDLVDENGKEIKKIII